MAWRLSGRNIGMCSCKMMCPCWLGPAEPDQGWCSGLELYEIQEGSSDGVDLSRCKLAFAIDLPGDFFAGNGTARLYIDQAASPEQRRELEAIFTGKKGGPWEALASAAITKWLPTRLAKMETQWGDSPSVRVDTAGQSQWQPLKDESGRPTSLQGAVAMGMLQLERLDLANSKGGRWSDPDMRRWESGGAGWMSNFNWSA